MIEEFTSFYDGLKQIAERLRTLQQKHPSLFKQVLPKPDVDFDMHDVLTSIQDAQKQAGIALGHWENDATE